ncbi:hypothetical protein ABTY61_05360 [Kitasatospora sp. NPDC096128]|uniref:hypothetical protein n=1 Tax=Kitasatospora sp. NPDC096128 TaxID=3155547 RepID=UPI00333317F7
MTSAGSNNEGSVPVQPLIDSAHATDGQMLKEGGDGNETGAAEKQAPPAALLRLRALAAHRWFWPTAVLLGYLAQLAFRLSLSIHNYYPSVHADEDGYLAIARVLAGRPASEMPTGVIIPGGYPLLISPALRIADNPATAYHLIMGINAVLNALVFPLAFVAARRLGLGRPHAFLAGTAVALFPPVIFYSQFVMTDAVLPVLLLVWLIGMHGWLSPGSLRRRSLHAVAMSLAAGYSMATHDRGGVVVALTALVLLVVLAFGWAPRLSSAVGIGALGVAFLGVKLLASYVTGQFKDVPGAGVGNKVFDNLETRKFLGTIIVRTFGELWYFMISTYGLGAIAFVLCVVAVFQRRFPVAERVVAFCMVAMLCGTALASAAGLADDNRVDNWVYARYCAVLVPVFVVVGLAVLFRAGTRSVLRLAGVGAVVLVVAGLSVTEYAGSKLNVWIIPWAVPDAQFLASTWDGLHMGRTTIGALAVLAACLLLRVAGGRRVVAAVVGCLTIFAAFATVAVTDNVAEPHSKTRKYESVGLAKEAGIGKDDSVILDWDLPWGTRMSLAFEVYQGRVWTSNVKHGNTPPEQATAMLLTYPKPKEDVAKDAKGKEVEPKPESSWEKPLPGWHVAKYSAERGWVLWRKG